MSAIAGLRAELDGARSALDAAGVPTTVDLPDGDRRALSIGERIDRLVEEAATLRARTELNESLLDDVVADLLGGGLHSAEAIRAAARTLKAERDALRAAVEEAMRTLDELGQVHVFDGTVPWEGNESPAERARAASASLAAALSPAPVDPAPAEGEACACGHPEDDGTHGRTMCKLEGDAEDDLLAEPCRVCGCTDYAACPGGCSWVESDLCSACVGREPEASR